MLGRKLARDLRRQRGQVIAVVTVIALGVLLFVASAAAYVDLRDSYAATRSRLALAGEHLDTTTAVSPADVSRVAAVPGVTSAAAREIAEVTAAVGDAHPELRLLELPDAGQPALDRVLVVAGRLPHAGELLVEKHFADQHHLAPGSTLALTRPDRRLTVAGVAVSAEYLWVARDAADFMPDPDEFGVGWVTPHELAGLPIAQHQLLVELAPGASLAAVEQALGSGRVLRATPADQLVGVRLLQLDVDGYRGMAAFFPVFFLAVGAFIVAALLARLVDAQRAIIGTLVALGVGRARVLGHFLGYGVVLGGAGALLGIAAGLVLAPAMTHAYAHELGIPFVTTRVHLDLAGYGLAMGLAIATLAAVVPALHASRMSPAQAMRPPVPSTGPLARAARRLRAPLPLEMAVRDLLGRPLRSLATATGVAAALVVVIVAGGLLDSMRTTFSATFHLARREDLRVELTAPAAAAVDDQLAALPGVRRAEGLISLPAQLAASGHTADVLVQGLAPDAALVRSVDADGTLVMPGAGEIVLPRAIARTLGVGPGDRVVLHVAAAASPASGPASELPAPATSGAAPGSPATGPAARGVAAVTLRVGGLADAAVGPVVSVRRADLAAALGAPGAVTSIALAVEPGHVREVRHALAARAGIARIQDTAAVRARMTELMGLGWVLVGAMLVFGSILAAAILFSTAILGVLEHRRDLATLRALGRTMREIATALTLEHALLAVAGIAIGIPIARLATRALVRSFASDLFALPFVISPATLALAAGGVLLVLLVAQWPALRAVNRMSLAEAVRSREG